MSRTYRNRKAVPKGWTVRDDGHLYYNGDDPYGREHRRCLLIRRGRWHRWQYKPEPRFRQPWYRKERTYERRQWYCQYRRKVKNLMRHERYDEIPPLRKTEGWESW